MEEMLIATLSIRDKNLILLIKKSIIARLLNQQNTDSFRRLSQPSWGRHASYVASWGSSPPGRHAVGVSTDDDTPYTGLAAPARYE